ncbi:hypothetical protein [Paraburkholderia sp. Ac-20347]|uniref:hypothetical protein n=1 Tax=Paraburkholderia sp. Ac-20347 TaxID=2703892 RepID=UPI00197FF842|nr:hypothetical protein [Paraburkholderia sp. Ac-20347]MBN3808883.1 hypothetical protein [Paraburkholderia sp. Ac-20347]
MNNSNPSVRAAPYSELPLQLVLERRSAGDWEAVERLCLAEFARNPGNAEIAWQLANAQWRSYDPAAAEATMRAADAANPGNGNVVAAIALFVAEQGRYGAARRLYERALALSQSALNASVDLAELELRNGAWKRGWFLYEARLSRQDRSPKSTVSIMERIAPRWSGQPLSGRTLLVYSEQGSGDDIQMVRLLPMLAGRVLAEGGQVVLACRKALFPLFARHFSPCVSIENGDLGRFGKPSYCLPMMSLPFALGLKPEQVHGIPYLSANMERAQIWRSRVGGASPYPANLQVGLVWRGNPDHRRDFQRSMQLGDIEQLFEVSGVTFHPLTPGCTSLPGAVPHCDLTRFYSDGFDDVAAHMAALDAVVSIDSAPLHLGGALGVPVFGMLDHVSQWAWGTGESQRWYSSVTMFRQPRPGDWRPVVERVAAKLRDLESDRETENE